MPERAKSALTRSDSEMAGHFLVKCPVKLSSRPRGKCSPHLREKSDSISDPTYSATRRNKRWEMEPDYGATEQRGNGVIGQQ